MMHITDVDLIKLDSSLNKFGDIFWCFTQNEYTSAFISFIDTTNQMLDCSEKYYILTAGSAFKRCL
uniref:Uncharacterized protein n=1 Tax=Yersinia enterocolitica TaxID=630 RepID=B0RKS0_YEREN|nr:hypothetical protein [Yersinia enterocolitica]